MAAKKDAGSDADLDTAALQSFFDAFGKAITQGDGKAIAKLWSVPALVVSGEGRHAISDRAEIAEFFGGAKAEYNKRGVVDTRAEIAWADKGGVIVTARVNWPHLDRQGNVVASESSTYTLVDDGGAFSIASVAMHGVHEG